MQYSVTVPDIPLINRLSTSRVFCAGQKLSYLQYFISKYCLSSFVGRPGERLPLVPAAHPGLGVDHHPPAAPPVGRLQPGEVGRVGGVGLPAHRANLPRVTGQSGNLWYLGQVAGGGGSEMFVKYWKDCGARELLRLVQFPDLHLWPMV